MKIEHLKQDFMTVCTFFAWACAIRFNLQSVLQIATAAEQNRQQQTFKVPNNAWS